MKNNPSLSGSDQNGITYINKSTDPLSRIIYYFTDKAIHDRRLWERFPNGLSRSQRKKQALKSIYSVRKKMDVKTMPRLFRIFNSVREHSVQGFPVYDIVRRGFNPHKALLYLHGGAFVSGPVLQQWMLISRLLKYAPEYKAVVLDYPKVPEHNAGQIIPAALECYKGVLKDYAPEDVVLMGDSAGASLSLSLMLELKRLNLPQPAKTIIISPATDMNYDNPDMDELESSDRMLCRPYIAEVIRMYAEGMNLDDPLISANFADYSDTAPIHMFLGDAELHYPDCMIFHEKTAKTNTPIHSYIGEKMQHDWLMFPTFDAVRATRMIAGVMKK